MEKNEDGLGLVSSDVLLKELARRKVIVWTYAIRDDDDYTIAVGGKHARVVLDDYGPCTVAVIRK